MIDAEARSRDAQFHGLWDGRRRCRRTFVLPPGSGAVANNIRIMVWPGVLWQCSCVLLVAGASSSGKQFPVNGTADGTAAVLTSGRPAAANIVQHAGWILRPCSTSPFWLPANTGSVFGGGRGSGRHCWDAMIRARLCVEQEPLCQPGLVEQASPRAAADHAVYPRQHRLQDRLSS